MQPPSPRFVAHQEPVPRAGWSIVDLDDNGYVVLGIEEEKAKFGAMMLNNEAIAVEGVPKDDVREEMLFQLGDVICEICEKAFMRAQMHNDRCPADQS